MDHRLRVNIEECKQKRGGLVTEHLCIGGQKKGKLYCWTKHGGARKPTKTWKQRLGEMERRAKEE
eukprot:2068112-Heterocapsa_arctica.AAC.1